MVVFQIDWIEPPNVAKVIKRDHSMEGKLLLYTQERLHQVWRTNVRSILLNLLCGL